MFCEKCFIPYESFLLLSIKISSQCELSSDGGTMGPINFEFR